MAAADVTRSLLLLLLLVVQDVSSASSAATAAKAPNRRGEFRCRYSIDIRNDPVRASYASLEDTRPENMIIDASKCTIVEGNVAVSMISSAIYTEHHFPIFQNLREITGYLLIYQVSGLTNLGYMFPNLRVIGGAQLVMNYALIVYQNADLVKLGLTRLRVIRNGGVRVMDNTRLCYARSLNWPKLIVGKIDDLRVGDSGLCDDTCELLDNSQLDQCARTSSGATACWDERNCQFECPYERLPNGTVDSGCVESLLGESRSSLSSSSTKVVPLPSAASSTVPFLRCHDECIAGCSAPSDPGVCYACKHFVYDGVCVDKCPAGHYIHMGHRCITKKECQNLSTLDQQRTPFKTIDGVCTPECPPGFRENEKDRHSCEPCVGPCPRVCSGNIQIESLGSAMHFANCEIVLGYIILSLRVGGNEQATSTQLSETLGRIQTIDGHLVVWGTPSILSLNMFRSLTKVTGKTLWNGVYALVVIENDNLRQLFPNNLTIGHGMVSIHNNQKLCFSKINSLLLSAGYNESAIKSPDLDPHVSRMSNGDKAICDESTFTVEVLDKSASSFVLKWTKFNLTNMDHRKFLGYQVFYRQVDGPDPNLDIDANRSVCADSWSSHYEMTDNGGALVQTNEIHPDTWYAFYVETRVVAHAGARNAKSRVGFVKTSFALPDAPRLGQVSLETNSLSLSWDVPLHPNGQVTHYWIRLTPVRPAQALHAPSVCQTHSVSEQKKENNHNNNVKQATATIRPTPESLLAMVKNGEPLTCSALPSCCECGSADCLQHHPNHYPDTKQQQQQQQQQRQSSSPPSMSREDESDLFENTVQNTVLVQRDYEDEDETLVPPLRRHRRSIDVAPPQVDDKPAMKSTGTNKTTRVSPQRSSGIAGRDANRKVVARPTTEDVTKLAGPDFNASSVEDVIDLNVTSLSLVIAGLRHYTEYSVVVRACQNTSVPENNCSRQPLWLKARTLALENMDEVNGTQIGTEPWNSSRSDAVVFWVPPERPNGPVRGYRVRMQNVDTMATPVEQCVSAADYESQQGRVVFQGLANGRYQVAVATITGAGTSSFVQADKLFHVYNPGFWTPWTISILAIAILVFFIAAGLVFWCLVVPRIVKKKVPEYIKQTISANPEYLSQFDIYKQDEWELRRDQLEMHEEIGSGTFGRVYRGCGRDATSHNGVHFGPCALKTVGDAANSAERFHFLMEASVMKQFDTSFIIKLYGVVSDGQPVLVVMEMMENGNLRDYLHKLRPDTKLVLSGAARTPDDAQLTLWAAQIADGMAYLESLKFCHRDLAARNIMVDASQVVKIGDFGMTRDLYYHEYYKPTGKRLMPVRWMAPESLTDGKFTVQSDVWSFGIVLFEMVTLGQKPYGAMSNEEVFKYIGMQKRVLEQPEGCSDRWYDLMKKCWAAQASERPSFRAIVQRLTREMRDVSRVDEDRYEHFHRLSFVANYCGEHPDASEPLSNDENEIDDDDDDDDDVEGENDEEMEDGLLMRRQNQQHDDVEDENGRAVIVDEEDEEDGSATAALNNQGREEWVPLNDRPTKNSKT